MSGVTHVSLERGLESNTGKSELLIASSANASSIAQREERNSLSRSPESSNVIIKSLIALTASEACTGVRPRGVGSITDISSSESDSSP